MWSLDQAKKMKVSYFLLCVALLAVNEARSRPSKASKAEKIDAELIDEKQCVLCILANALPCISKCIPNPSNKECVACILSIAPQCLGPCGKLLLKYSSNTIAIFPLCRLYIGTCRVCWDGNL